MAFQCVRCKGRFKTQAALIAHANEENEDGVIAIVPHTSGKQDEKKEEGKKD